MTAGVMPDMRSIARSIVLHMSAQFMQAGAQSIIWDAHTVQACSHAAQASMHACMRSMSMRVSPPIIDVEPMASIIMRSIPYLALDLARRGRCTRLSPG